MPSQAACFSALRQTVSNDSGLGVALHALVAVAFDQALDPHEEIGPHRLRTGVAAPDAAEQAGDQEQRDRAHDQQAGQVVDVLRPELEIEEVEALVPDRQQHRLVRLVDAAMPAQPGQQIVDAEADDQHRPFEAAHRAVHRLRIDPHAVGVEMIAGLLALELELTIGLADAGHVRSGLPRSLPAAQRMHVQSQALDRRLVEAGVPGRHHAHPRRGDLCHHGGPVVAIEMHVRGQPRRTLLAIPLPCSP